MCSADYHIAEYREQAVDASTHAVITHGDDECLQRSGGVACEIRRMAPGYATLLRTPLTIDAIFNDFRAEGSDGLGFYLLATFRGAPHNGQYKAFTEMRLVVVPTDCMQGYFGTYLVPTDRLTIYWKEGTWWRTAKLLHAYVHTHPAWTEEIMLYTGASGLRLGMGALNLSQRLTVRGGPRKRGH